MINYWPLILMIALGWAFFDYLCFSFIQPQHHYQCRPSCRGWYQESVQWKCFIVWKVSINCHTLVIRDLRTSWGELCLHVIGQMCLATFLRWFLNSSSGEKCVNRRGSSHPDYEGGKPSEASLPRVRMGRGAPPSLTAEGKSVILTCRYSVP